MDSRSDDCGVSDSGQAAVVGDEEADAGALTADGDEETLEEALDESRPYSGCFTEAELNALLPPIPDWARKPPVATQPLLFDLAEEE